MKISTNWLSAHVDHNLPVEELAELLTMCGLEVESIDRFGAELEGVVVGHVVESGKHPNADRLSVCRVDVGADAPLHIVCGAPNVAAGQRVAVATVGTVLSLPDRDNPGARVALKIKRSKIRGEVSEGMICAEDELGLGDDHDGILVLDPSSPIGEPVASVLASSGQPVGDTVIDIAITPNRPDATSHVGVARDVAAITQNPLKMPDVSIPGDEGDVAGAVQIDIEAPDGCPRFAAMIVRGVTIKPSPAWLQARLRAVGLRPRNNVVDVSNYVMLELGQPLHTYDLDTIAGQRIVVRETAGESKFTTLDEKERVLPAGTLMVCDGEREIGVAGIMGGMNTEVTDATTNVLIEGAYWNPAAIRSTAKALGLQTDASYRFERGVDTDGQARAVARAASLIAELGDGQTLDGILDIRAKPQPVRTVTLRLPQIARHLGGDVPYSDVERLLSAIGFTLERRAQDRVACTIPSNRPDITREIDVIEEIARLHGYDAFPMPEATRVPNFTPTDRPVDKVLRGVHEVALGSGFREIYTNSLISEEVATRFSDRTISTATGSPVVTANAITSEMTTLRPSLLAGALPALQYNSNRGQRQLRLFEVGNIFAKDAQASSGVVRGYEEHTSLLLLASGPRAPRAFDAEPDNTDYFDLKGVVEAIGNRLRVTVDFTRADDTSLAEYIEYGEHVEVAGMALGIIARLTDGESKRLDLQAPVVFAELNLSRLVEAYPVERPRYTPVARFPEVGRDLAVVVDEGVPAASLLATTRANAGPLLVDTDIFDIYRGKGVADDKKSVAISMKFGTDRTLTDEEVDAAVKAVVAGLRAAHGGELRA